MPRFLACLALVAVACGPQTAADNVRDVTVPLPAADPAFADFSTPEKVIAAGEEKMWCARVDYTGESTAFTEVDGQQGKFGHHIVLLQAKADDTSAVGDVYDCTKMTNFEPFAIPVNGAPEGYATALDQGKRLIIQMHYINTGAVPIKVRDVVRLRKKSPAEVTKWTSVYATNHVGFSLPPHSEGTSVTYECALPADVELLAFGGHMHEFGASFTAMISEGAAGAMSELYKVTAWQPVYRDTPPINLYTTAPKSLKQGSVLRSTCTWNNTSDKLLEFPEEMCATFGLVGGVRDPVVCTVGMKQ